MVMEKGTEMSCIGRCLVIIVEDMPSVLWSCGRIGIHHNNDVVPSCVCADQGGEIVPPFFTD